MSNRFLQISISFKRFLRVVIVFLLIFTWFFSGWPQIFNFPPKIQEAQAAIAVGTTTTNTGDVASFSFAHNGGTGTDRLLIVRIMIDNGTNISGTPTYGGVSLTLVNNTVHTSDKPRVIVYRLINPLTGSNTLAGSFAASDKYLVAATNVTGVDQTTPIDGVATTIGAAGTTMTVTVTSATGDLVMDATANQGSSVPTVGAGQTQNFNVEMIGSGHRGTGSHEAGAASVIMSWSGKEDTKDYVSVGFNINQVVAPTFEQSAYRLFNNQNSTQVGEALAAQDASTTLSTTGQDFRLRMLLHVTTASSTPGANNLKLQFATSTPGGCDYNYVGETYVDVATSTGDIRFLNNATPVDGALLTATGTDPTHGADTVVNQTYEEANNFTATSTIGIGQDGKWDFALDDFSAPAGTTYCFRVVKSDNSLIATSTNTKIPEIRTAAAGITISGTIYTDEGQTTSTDGWTVSLVVNGTWTASTTASTTDGSYSFSNVTQPTTSTHIAVYLDNSSGKGVTVTRYYGSGNVTGLNIYQNRIIARHEDSGPITIANLDYYDSTQDSDILFTAASSTGTLLASSTSEFFIWSATTTFGAWGTGGVGGTTTLADLDIRGTFTATSSQFIYISGNWDATTTAVFNSASSTVQFTATTTGKTIRTNGKPFWNLTFSGSSGSWSFQDAATTTNDLTITAGTSSSAYDMRVYGGDVTGNGVLNWTANTFLVDGTGNFGGTSDWTFYNLTFGNGTGVETTTATSTATTTISNVLTIAPSQVLNAGNNKTWVLSGSGTPFVINGTFNYQTSTFKYTGTSDTYITDTDYYNLMLGPEGG